MPLLVDIFFFKGIVIAFNSIYNLIARKNLMATFKIKVTNIGGLTSRSSAELVEEANHHKCDVIRKLEDGEECDLKSIRNVFGVHSIQQGEMLTIVCTGDDEKEAVEGFQRLSEQYSF